MNVSMVLVIQKGWKGGEIRIEAKIISVIDSFDAMTSDRPYRMGLTIEEAIEELHRFTGNHYEPFIVKAFLEVLDDSRIKR